VMYPTLDIAPKSPYRILSLACAPHQ
jgi:hypothetical protein